MTNFSVKIFGFILLNLSFTRSTMVDPLIETPAHELISVSLRRFEEGSLREKLEIARTFDKAMQQDGFIHLCDAGLDKEKDDLFRDFITFFDKTESEKVQFSTTGKFGSEGFWPFGSESQSKTADDASNQTSVADMVEVYFRKFHQFKDLQAMRDGTDGIPMPSEVKDSFVDYFEKAAMLTERIYRLGSFALLSTDPKVEEIIAESDPMQMERNFNIIQDGFWSDTEPGAKMRYLLRVNHYFDLSEVDVRPGALRIGEHQDYVGFTLLSGTDVGGLQFKKNGKWVDVKTRPQCFIVNTGLALSLMTHWTAIKHRVVASTTKRRLSAALFTNPDDKVLIRPFSRCYACDKIQILNPESEYQSMGDHRDRLIKLARL
mmetsp:Transcript_24378/g.36573  ORF Transcript_24378/g.36573 Transcript_24378/m.36573 type:complete len:375 (-) Transcript_24378:167-1291(-)|eukprot:CAMPEP_0167748302 /NCGR_PEP_ID=MMETSP0110_2-20121227/4765_1 /TAXON_ID=629695 /ORGANISM="Gymnochlora sp., Strain CCMP2014" /LENGTH=374 /DNA_ID=CAMNT_0007633307 /DNA_START=23 /DNA_END=1147 /DNA_ORIENTATION=+